MCQTLSKQDRPVQQRGVELQFAIQIVGAEIISLRREQRRCGLHTVPAGEGIYIKAVLYCFGLFN